MKLSQSESGISARAGATETAKPPLLAMALSVAAVGWPVFPCGEDKKPRTDHGFKDATTDPAKIKRLFSRPQAKLIGVPTGKVTGFDILDLDPRHGSDDWRQSNIHQLPETRVHRTMRGGEHWAFRHVEGVHNTQNGKAIAPGVDVRGEGGYVIVPPSPGYIIKSEADVADWPDWLLPLVLKKCAPSSRPPTQPTKSFDQLEKRFRGYVEALLGNVRDAKDGAKHDTLLKQARALGGIMDAAGIGEEDAVQRLIEALPDSVEDWDNARKTARDGLRDGRKHSYELEDRQRPSRPVPPPPEAEPAPEPPPEPSPVESLIAEFNAKFFVLNEHGKAVIYAPRHDPILNRKYYDRMSFEDFEKLYCNRFIQIGVEKDGAAIRRRVAPVWLNHSDRHQYIGGVVFDPSGRKIAPDVLNLWRGFAVESREGDWSKLRQHILDVVCNYDQTLYEYLLDWMADLVQTPAKQGEVAIVLRGPEGSGKGILARAIKYLFGQHGLAISNAKHLVGNFNGHLRDAVFLFADEAFYAGDKQHVGVLKALITEPYLTIEGKYQNAVQMPNFLHVMMASNEEWVVPASLDSRRWLVIDVQGNKINAHGYFGTIQKQLDDGGHAAMLHDLLNRDLSKSNLRAVPVTDALQTQRKMSLDTTHRWWVDCLHRGYVFQSRLGFENHFGEWHDFVTTEVLYASYSRYCIEARERHPMSRELFGRWMVSAGAKPTRRRKQIVGEHMVDATTDGRTTRIAELVMHPIPTGYDLGDLDAARDSFSSASGLRVDWGGEAEGCSG